MQFTLPIPVAIDRLRWPDLAAHRAQLLMLLSRIPTTDTDWGEWLDRCIRRSRYGGLDMLDPIYSFAVWRRYGDSPEEREPLGFQIANRDRLLSRYAPQQAVYLSKAATDSRTQGLDIFFRLFSCTLSAALQQVNAPAQPIIFTKVERENPRMIQLCRDRFGGHELGDAEIGKHPDVEKWAGKGGDHAVIEWTVQAAQKIRQLRGWDQVLVDTVLSYPCRWQEDHANKA